jgi:hypothetical protein
MLVMVSNATGIEVGLLAGKYPGRTTEPGTQPLVTGAAARVGRLRAYGNAIVAPLAAEWIRAVMGAIGMNTTEAA